MKQASTTERKQPPAAALFLLSIFLQERERETIQGDLAEEFQSRPSAAWFWVQVLSSLGHLAWLAMRRTPGRMIAAMLAGYFSMAFAVMALFGVWQAAGGPQSEAILLRFELAGGFLCAILGGYLSARISRGSGVNGMIGLCVFTSLMACLSLLSEPWWKELALISVFVPGMLTGGYLRALEARRDRT